MNFEKCKRNAERMNHWIQPWVPFLVRITLGFIFIQSGWGKLHHLDKVTNFFTELGIPAPFFQARLVAMVEFVGGLCILTGFFTRVASVPLACTMVVALITAKKDDISGFDDLTGTVEYLYLLLLLVLVAQGAGCISLDHLTSKIFNKGNKREG